MRAQCGDLITKSDVSAVPEPSLSYEEAFPKIIVPTGLALLLCNMDRIVMSVAILPIAKEFNWAPSMQVLTLLNIVGLSSWTFVRNHLV